MMFEVSHGTPLTSDSTHSCHLVAEDVRLYDWLLSLPKDVLRFTYVATCSWVRVVWDSFLPHSLCWSWISIPIVSASWGLGWQVCVTTVTKSYSFSLIGTDSLLVGPIVFYIHSLVSGHLDTSYLAAGCVCVCEGDHIFLTHQVQWAVMLTLCRYIC